MRIKSAPFGMPWRGNKDRKKITKLGFPPARVFFDVCISEEKRKSIRLCKQGTARPVGTLGTLGAARDKEKMRLPDAPENELNLDCYRPPLPLPGQEDDCD